jgi:HPt (histidine-containing phosphotransfer) domain-containing protein
MKSSYLLDDEKIRTILPGFLATLEQQLQKVEHCQDRGDLAALGTAGHTLKGALLNLGLFELADAAYKIEQQGKRQETDTDCPALIGYLRKNILLISGREDQS